MLTEKITLSCYFITAQVMYIYIYVYIYIYIYIYICAWGEQEVIDEHKKVLLGH